MVFMVREVQAEEIRSTKNVVVTCSNIGAAKKPCLERLEEGLRKNGMFLFEGPMESLIINTRDRARATLYQVRIHRATSADLWVQVSGKSTILDIKRKIFEDGAIPPDHQKLTFNGKVLANDRETLEEAGIGSEAELWVEAV